MSMLLKASTHFVASLENVVARKGDIACAGEYCGYLCDSYDYEVMTWRARFSC